MSIIPFFEAKLQALQYKEAKMQEAFNLLQDLPKNLTHKVMVKHKN